MVDIDLTKKLSKIKYNKNIKNLSAIKLIKYYLELVKDKESINNLKANEMDRVIKVLVELRIEMIKLIKINLKGNSRDFAKLKVDEGVDEDKIIKLLKELQDNKNNSLSLLTR